MQIRRRCRITDSETWYFKGGLRTKFNHLGATVFYGEYLTADGAGSTSMLVRRLDVADEADVGTIDELNVWGLGVVQEVDAAAMSVWVKYRNASADTTTFDPARGSVSASKTSQYVGVGGLINF